MGFIDACDNYKKFQSEFNETIVNTIQETGDDLVVIVTEQLYSGLDGNENNLTPTYTADPFFDSSMSKRWRYKGEQYKNFKNMITPPRPSFIGFKARGEDTPNLFITGRFHDSITFNRTNTGISIFAGSELGNDIETKYGKEIFKISGTGKKYWYDKFFKPVWDKFITKYKK